MPRLDGYQTCALIKRSPRFAGTPVVMLSSKDGLFDRARGRMVGSSEYLTKPFTKDSLLRRSGALGARDTGSIDVRTLPGTPVKKVLVVDDCRPSASFWRSC